MDARWASGSGVMAAGRECTIARRRREQVANCVLTAMSMTCFASSKCDRCAALGIKLGTGKSAKITIRVQMLVMANWR